VTTPNRKFGALRDVHDVRDRMYRPARRPAPVPQHVDLRQWAGPIKDQGDEGSCTGHAFSSAREWMARRYERTSPILSPQCLYVEELLADGSFPKDEGAMPRTGCQVLTAKGCCETALYPYVAGKFTAPTPEQSQNALKYKTGAYHRIGTLPDFLSCLADATPWPVLVGSLHRICFLLDLCPGIFQRHGAVEYEASGLRIRVHAKISQAFELIAAFDRAHSPAMAPTWLARLLRASSDSSSQ
jgi:hypothetical protein